MTSTRTIEANVRITTEDGIELVGDLYIPAGKGPFPAVFEITPYDARGLEKAGTIYADRGFLFLAVDTRGRYRSSGSFEPITHDRADGHAVIAWLMARDDWGGRIGARGHSYSAHAALQTAVDAPEAFRAVVALSAPSDAFDNVPFRGGAYDLQDLIWLSGMTGRVTHGDMPHTEWGPERFGSWSIENTREPDYTYELAAVPEPEPDPDPAEDLIDALMGSPFCEVDLRLRRRMEVFRTWLDHPEPDAYWAARRLRDKADRMQVAVLHAAGHWDENAGGAAHYYPALRANAGTEDARKGQKLLLGPWTHDFKAPDLRDLPEHEGALVRRAADYDTLNDELAFFDHHLKDIPFGVTNDAPARVFVTGLFRWREYDAWPPTEATETTWKLDVDGKRATLSQDDPTPHGPLWVAGRPRPFNSAETVAERADIIAVETPCADDAWSLLGPVGATVFATADKPSFDVCARLFDVYPDGRTVFLVDGVRRVRATAGEVTEVNVDLWQVAHTIRKGHRLRVEFAPAAALRWDVNPGSDDVFGHAPPEDIHLSLHAGDDHPSRLDFHSPDAFPGA